jgi:hypothetical protein
MHALDRPACGLTTRHCGWYWAVDTLVDHGAEVDLAHPLG